MAQPSLVNVIYRLRLPNRVTLIWKHDNALGSMHPSGGILGGTLTANVVSGMAIFTNLSLSLAGNYSMSAKYRFGARAQHHQCSR
jgi:hypothetical protein